MPRLAFREAEATARQERIEDIVTAIQARGLHRDRDFDQLGPFLAEVDRIFPLSFGSE